MDEIRFWDNAKSETEINNTINSCLTGNETGLLNLVNLNDSIGSSIAINAANNGNHGTLTSIDVNTAWVSGNEDLNCNSCDTEVSTMVSITINPISDRTVGITDTELCLVNTGTTVTLDLSEVGVNYYLRDDANDTIVDGPIVGDGNALTFNTGSLSSSMTYNVFGEVKNIVGLDFDGVDDYVHIPTPTFNQYSTNQYAVEAWIYLESYTGKSTIVEDRGKLRFWIDETGLLHFTSEHGGMLDLVSSSSVPLNERVHVAVLYNDFGTYCKFIINGQISAETTGATYTEGSLPDNGLSIGGNVSGSTFGGFLDGKIDDLRIWTGYYYGTDESTIVNNMNVCMTGMESGLDLFFNFNEGSGATSTDVASNGDIGTLTNMDIASAWTAGVGTCNSGASCEQEMTTTVSVSNPTTPTISIDDFGSLLCHGDANSYIDANIINGNGILLIDWDNDGTGDSDTEDLSGLTAGTYNVVVTDAIGCAASESVTIAQPDSLELAYVANAILCNGGSTDIDVTVSGGQPNYSYDWHNDGSYNDNEDSTNVVAGSYIIKVTDDAGCMLDSTITIGEPDALTLSATGTDEMFGTDGAVDLTVTGGTTPYGYDWDNNETSEDISALVAGSYEVIVTDANGCMDSVTTTISTQVSIDEKGNVTMNVYPNPSNGIINIEFSQNIDGTITVFDAVGQIVLVEKITSTKQKINLENNERGLYFLQVENNNYKKVINVILQ